jgi:mannose-6-phosphate isomerase
MNLQRLASRFLQKAWGSEIWYEAPPLLVKFITTFDKLSVQVHPDDEYARVHHHCSGKTEMWHILAAQPGAQIAAGFREPVSKECLRDAALSGEIMNILQWHDASPGDTFFIPAGTVHAIGEGLVLCEIQQHSDVTYRLYDYGRRRELHLEHALEVSRRDPHPARGGLDGDVLVACDHFVTRRLQIKDSAQIGPFNVMVVTEGEGSVENQPVRAGEVWHAGRHAGRHAGNLDTSGNFTALTVLIK